MPEKQNPENVLSEFEKGIALSKCRIIEGKDAVSLYRTIVANGWATQLSHAAYLGKELDRAELSMKLDFKYIQDGA